MEYCKIPRDQRRVEYCNIPFEQRWSDIENVLTKMMKKILEGESLPSLGCEEPMCLYTTIFDMCVQKPPHDYSQQLYDKFGEIIENYTKQTGLPSLREKNDEDMLRELVLSWSNHKVMVRFLSRVFSYLDRYFVILQSLPTLKEVGLRCFHDLVYHEMHSKAIIALVTQIHEEREGKEIDRTLMKNVLDVFIENAESNYEEDFESLVLHDTVTYYFRMATNWIGEHSCPEYMIKAEKCLKKEKERVSHYLRSSTESKLIEMDDLSRMFRLYHKIPQGLEPIAEIFKQHVTAEGHVLIKQAEDAASNQVLIGKVTDLHDKYMVCVTECFQNHTLFHKALKEAFEIFCEKSVAGSSSAELLATFCDNTLN